MKDEYADVKQDLYGAFVVRGIELVDRCGLLAIVIGDTWMSLKSFEALRTHLLDGHTIDSLLHLRDSAYHADTFGANTAFVLSMAGDCSRRAPFVRLTPLGSDDKEQDLKSAIKVRRQDVGYFLASGEDFASIPGTPIVYWLSEKMRAVFKVGRPLGKVAELRQGLKTADNDRFLRQWWEVAGSRTAFSCRSRNDAEKSGAHWFPYNKGGDFRRWYGNQAFVVNWANDGDEIRAFGTEDGGRPKSRVQATEFFFMPSISWPEVSSGASAFRAFPEGFIFDSTGSSGFMSEDTQRLEALAIANSSVTSTILEAVAPGLRFDVGQVAKIPILESAESRHETKERVEKLISTAQRDWDSAETSWNFRENPLAAIR
jgi:hypothetical protein